jgi:hypothetical protein
VDRPSGRASFRSPNVRQVLDAYARTCGNRVGVGVQVPRDLNLNGPGRSAATSLGGAWRAPAACWCARTIVESTAANHDWPSASLQPACNADRIRSQVTPADQRRCRLWTVWYGLNRSGRSRQGHPVRTRWNTQSMINRWSDQRRPLAGVLRQQRRQHRPLLIPRIVLHRAILAVVPERRRLPGAAVMSLEHARVDAHLEGTSLADGGRVAEVAPGAEVPVETYAHSNVRTPSSDGWCWVSVCVASDT